MTSLCPNPDRPLHRWYVVSPEFVIYQGDEYEPDEWGSDVAEGVDAPTKREAVRFGVPLMKDWMPEARSDGSNPFIGCSAYKPECPHMGCQCAICHPELDWEEGEQCEGCKAEHRAECYADYAHCWCWTAEEEKARRRLDREVSTATT